MSDEPKVGDLYVFKGLPPNDEEPEYIWAEDIGIILSYNEETKQGLIYWLRYPDPDEDTRTNNFYWENIDTKVMHLHTNRI